MTKHNLGNVEDFPEGEGREVDVNGINVAVFNIDGELYGIQNSCTHKRLPLHLAGSPTLGRDGEEKTRGEIDGDGKCIRCPWHRLTWDLETGRNEATGREIATYEIDIDDGNVLLET